MTDWMVKVVTHNNQTKNVRINDCIYPDDAVAAAMSQTAAKQMLNYYPISESYQSDSSDTYTYYDEPSYNDVNIPDWRSNDTYTYWTAQFLMVTSIPTVILMFINPLFAILFNVALGYWWFHDLKCNKW